MYRKAKCLSSETRKTLSMALIQCHFDYSCSSWYAGISKGLKNKLKVAQNKTARFIMGPRTTIKQKELSSLGFLNVESRVKQLRLNHVHKIFNNTCPSYLKNNFVRINEHHTYSTRVIITLLHQKLKVVNVHLFIITQFMIGTRYLNRSKPSLIQKD